MKRSSRWHWLPLESLASTDEFGIQQSLRSLAVQLVESAVASAVAGRLVVVAAAADVAKVVSLRAVAVPELKPVTVSLG